MDSRSGYVAAACVPILETRLLSRHSCTSRGNPAVERGAGSAGAQGGGGGGWQVLVPCCPQARVAGRLAHGKTMGRGGSSRSTGGRIAGMRRAAPSFAGSASPSRVVCKFASGAEQAPRCVSASLSHDGPSLPAQAWGSGEGGRGEELALRFLLAARAGVPCCGRPPGTGQRLAPVTRQVFGPRPPAL